MKTTIFNYDAYLKNFSFLKKMNTDYYNQGFFRTKYKDFETNEEILLLDVYNLLTLIPLMSSNEKNFRNRRYLQKIGNATRVQNYLLKNKPYEFKSLSLTLTKLCLKKSTFLTFLNSNLKQISKTSKSCFIKNYFILGAPIYNGFRIYFKGIFGSISLRDLKQLILFNFFHLLKKNNHMGLQIINWVGFFKLTNLFRVPANINLSARYMYPTNEFKWFSKIDSPKHYKNKLKFFRIYPYLRFKLCFVTKHIFTNRL